MARVLVIMAVRTDKNCEAKRATIAKAFGDDALLPRVVEINDPQDFDLVEAIRKLKEAKLVIADLSFERPSCYYELGMAQGLGLPTLLLAQEGTRLYQHSGAVTFYKDLEEFQQIVEAASAEYANEYGDP
jgi:nucleoside 2-deoxyribosyltransferase